MEENNKCETEYYSCGAIDQFMTFNGSIEEGNKPLMFCCEPLADIPGMELCDTGKETIENYIELRRRAVSEGAALPENRTVTRGCEGCTLYTKKNWNTSGMVTFINLSMYPSPCQCRCCYCFYRSDIEELKKESVTSSYEKLFDALHYAQNSGLIAPNAFYSVAPGEITIHPFRDRIFDLVKNKHTRFHSNCFIFSEDIAENLKNNPGSRMNFSIDCGTPETWKKVKGFDNFTNVIENLTRYCAINNQNTKLELKYIILPGINDSKEDFYGIVNLMKKLGISCLNISRDISNKYSMSETDIKKLAIATSLLLVVLRANDLKYTFQAYSDIELRTINILMDRITNKA